MLKSPRSAAHRRVMERLTTPPGQHGMARTRKMSTYGIQLREKQSLRRIYGVLERQFRRYFERADRYRGVTGTVLLQLLERRLDNVVFRAGFASTRTQARQIVGHKHILVNGRAVNIPSYEVNVGDVITVKEKSREMAPIQQALQSAKQNGRKGWIEFNEETLEATFKAIPERDDLDDIAVREQLIVELYSK